MSDKQEQSTNDVPSNQANNQAKWRDVWLTEDDVKGKTAFVDTSSGKSLTHIKLSEVLNAKYGPPSDFEQRIRADEREKVNRQEAQEDVWLHDSWFRCADKNLRFGWKIAQRQMEDRYGSPSEHIGKAAGERYNRAMAVQAKIMESQKKQLADARAEVEELTEENRLACLYAVKNAPQCFDVIHQDYPEQMDIAKALCTELAAKDELLREVLSVAYQTKEINRHPMLCLKEIREMIKAKLEESR